MKTYDIAIDLGTKYTKIISKKDNNVMIYPSIVALKDDKPIAYGDEVYKLSNITKKNIKLISPFENGKITNKEAAKKYIGYIEKQINKKKLRILLIAPHHLTEDDKEKIKNIFLLNGLLKCFFMDEVFVLANGLNVDTFDEKNHFLLVDIGMKKVKIHHLHQEEILYSHLVQKDELIKELKNFINKSAFKISGICIAGGGALDEKLVTNIKQSLNIKVHIAKNPQLTLINGARKSLKNLNVLDKPESQLSLKDNLLELLTFVELIPRIVWLLKLVIMKYVFRVKKLK